MLVLFILLLITFLFSFCFKKSFGKVLPITLMVIPLVLFLSAFIFHTFFVGVYFSIFLAIVGMGVLLKKMIKKEKESLKLIFSKGFFACIFLFLFLVWIDFQREFSVWDELAHWGMMVKEMLRLDKFYAVPESLLVWHKDYPPFMSLWEYFWCFLSGYKEQTVLLSIHFFELGLIVPYVVDTLKKKSMIILFPLLFVSVLLMFDSYNIFLTAQTDFTISIEVVFSLFFLFSEKKDSYYKKIIFSLSLVSLLLTKQIGLPFTLMIITFYLIHSIWIEKRKWSDKKHWISSIVFLILPFFFYAIWGYYTTMMNTGAQFSMGNMNLKEYFNIISLHQGVDYKLKAISLFHQYLFTEPVLIKPFSLGYIPCSILFFLIFFIFFIIHRKEFSWKKFLTFSFLFLCGTIGYALIMSVLYLFCFSENETITLACFGRYMSSYIVIEFLFLLCLQFYYGKDKPYFTLKNILFTIICLLSVAGSLKEFMTSKQTAHYENFKRVAEEVQKTEKNSKIFVIMEDSSFTYLLPYYLDSRVLDSSFYDFYHFMEDYEKEKVLDILFQQDYLYINDIPENFNQEYKSIFDSPIKERTLYKINKEERKASIYE